MCNANSETIGGYIDGEVKIAISLRLLEGVDAYDIAVIFDINSDYCNKILYYTS